MNEAPKDAPKVMMLPPSLLVLHISAGIILDWAIPLSFGHVWGWLGLVLVILAFAITKWAKDLFRKAGTNVPPNQPALVIIKEGPYRFSRNPMYVCFALILTGLSLLADAPLMLAMVVPLVYFLDRHVIVPEETYLTEKFGSVYQDYKSQVRRWL